MGIAPLLARWLDGKVQQRRLPVHRPHQDPRMAELALLEQLFEEGLPVPEPIAAKVERFGLWYRADILIRRIHGAEDLVALLQKQAMSRPQWQQLGA